jgi:hypothetical protein
MHSNDEAFYKFKRNIIGAKSLFGPEINQYLNKLCDVYSKVCEISDQQAENDFKDDNERQELLAIKRDYRTWMRKQFDEAEKLFKKYLDLSKA